MLMLGESNRYRAYLIVHERKPKLYLHPKTTGKGEHVLELDEAMWNPDRKGLMWRSAEKALELLRC